MNRFPKFLFATLLTLALGSGLKASILTQVSVYCAAEGSTIRGSSDTGSSGATCPNSRSFADASSGGVDVLAERNGSYGQYRDSASASVTSSFLLSFLPGSPGATSGFYTPCFVLDIDSPGGGGGTASFSSSGGSVSAYVQPRFDRSQTCIGKIYLPFQYGIPQLQKSRCSPLLVRASPMETPP
jgi:hypothetical protein